MQAPSTESRSHIPTGGAKKKAYIKQGATCWMWKFLWKVTATKRMRQATLSEDARPRAEASVNIRRRARALNNAPAEAQRSESKCHRASGGIPLDKCT